jgi:co-chaperonin GroES (HSP10)
MKQIKRYKPLFARIKVKPDPKEDVKTKSGIYITKEIKTSETDDYTGTLIEVGNGCSYLDESYIGSSVLYGKYAGFSRKEDEMGKKHPDGQEYVYMQEEDIIGILE